MNIIFITNRKEITKTLRIHAGILALSVMALCMVPVLTGYFGYKRSANVEVTPEQQLTMQLRMQVGGQWQKALESYEQEIQIAKENADSHLKVLTMRMAELQSRLVRIDALGDRMVLAAGLTRGEFDFSQPPPIGGPQEGGQSPYEPPSFLKELNQLTERIEERETQLAILERLLANKRIEENVFIAGRPILKGWMSSSFGRRTDPFTGQLAWHKGVDFAGKDGSDIVSVGSGVVTLAGRRSGYGYLVEINHGNGYSTRYGHCKKILVNVGDIVLKGQVLALMGSTGRSTGPHVHFEVLKDGIQVNPHKYVKREAKH